MRDLLMVIPSRGRPHNIARLIDAMDATCNGQTDLVVGLDADDPTREDYPGRGSSEPRGILYVVKPDLHKVTAWCNELAVAYADEYKYIGHFGDDSLPQTQGWDVQVVQALERTPFAFGNDQYPYRQPGLMACHVFMRSDVVKTLGYFGPPSIAHMYVDVAWTAWGQACGITFLPDVNLEHLHHSSGRAPLDATYQASAGGTGADREAWHAYCRSGQLNEDIRKLGGDPFTDEVLARFNRDLGT